MSTPAEYALICFSQLRWNFVDRGLRHLMGGFAGEHRVLFWEEPVFGDRDEATLDVRACSETGVVVIAPQLPAGRSESEQEATLRTLLEIFLAGQQRPLIRWYRTPAMLPFTRHIDAVCTIHDGTHQPAGFGLASARRLELERELLGLAEIVITSDGPQEMRMVEDPQLRRLLSSVLGVGFDRTFRGNEREDVHVGGSAFMLDAPPALPTSANPRTARPATISAQ